MRYYLRKQKFSHTSSFEAYDQEENVVFLAKANVDTQEAQLRLYDTSGKELVFISEKPAEKYPTFEISINNRLFATLNKEVSWKHRAFIVDSDQGQFMVYQNFSCNNLEITWNGTPCGSIKRDSLVWRETHTLELETTDHTEFFMAMILTIINFDDYMEELQTERGNSRAERLQKRGF